MYNFGDKILKNKAQCGRCKDIVESKYGWDFQRCSCGGIFVDGGLNYLRRGYEPGVAIIELSEYEQPNNTNIDGKIS